METDFSAEIHPPVWTVGHSTHPIGEFIALLQSAAIMIVADVRRFPGSRRYSQYNQPALADALAAERICARSVDRGCGTSAAPPLP